MTRLRAFGLHLTGSALVFIIFLGLMFFIWYPSPYFEINSGWTVLRILAGVDVVLGPLLTLIVFKPGKPSLKFDMSIILLMQLGALAYGASIVYQQRPAFVVFVIDRFNVIPAADVEFSQIKYKELKQNFQIGPVFAQARFPDDPKLHNDLLFKTVLGGEKDLEYRAEFYEPYQPNLAELKTRGINILDLTKSDANARQVVDAFITRRGGHIEDYLYLPLQGKKKDIILALSAKDGMPLDWISISPWPSDYSVDQKIPATSPENQPSQPTPQQ